MTLLSARRIAALLGAALLACVAPASADEPPAAVQTGSKDEMARASFQKFAQSWMQKMKRQEQPGASPMSSRGYDDDFKIELRPTGHARAPYVGILRYTELHYSCSGGASDCPVDSTVPVTEIFRFEAGRWVY